MAQSFVLRAQQPSASDPSVSMRMVSALYPLCRHKMNHYEFLTHFGVAEHQARDGVARCEGMTTGGKVLPYDRR